MQHLQVANACCAVCDRASNILRCKDSSQGVQSQPDTSPAAAKGKSHSTAPKNFSCCSGALEVMQPRDTEACTPTPTSCPCAVPQVSKARAILFPSAVTDTYSAVTDTSSGSTILIPDEDYEERAAGKPMERCTGHSSLSTVTATRATTNQKVFQFHPSVAIRVQCLFASKGTLNVSSFPKFVIQQCFREEHTFCCFHTVVITP